MKFLVIGSSGLLGTTLLAKGKEVGFDVVGADLPDVDITSETSVRTVLDLVRPAIVINSAAYTDVEGAETPEGFEIASKVNGDGPGNLAAACRERGTPFIHLSTDYVFNGTDASGVSEDIVPGEPMNAYGKTKRMGEKNIIEIAGIQSGSDFSDMDSALYIVRLSWLFGHGAKNFVGKIAERAKTQGKVSVVDDEIGCPLFTDDFAKFLLSLIHDRPAPGIYHPGGQGSCSRYEFATEVLKHLNIPATITPCKLSDFPRKAHIANISILRNTKRPALRPWQEMVEEYAKATRT
ncbi:MAG: NAD(P)-dependent oxidoreductase [Patescibacteria group bacterium]